MNTLTEIIDIQIKMQKSICYRELQKLSDMKKTKAEIQDKTYLGNLNLINVNVSTYDSIIEACCAVFEITKADILSGSRQQPIPDCVKMIAVVTHNKYLNLSKMGEMLKKNHTTISTAKKSGLIFLNDKYDVRNKLFTLKYDAVINKLK